MTLLDQVLEMARALSPRDQDEITRVIRQLAGPDSVEAIPLSQDEREAVDRSKAAAARGEFATDEQIRAVWAKHAYEAALHTPCACRPRRHS